MNSLTFPAIASHTRRYISPTPAEIDMSAGFLFAASSTEPRGHIPLWQTISTSHSGQCIAVSAQKRDEIEVRVGASTKRWVSLKDDSQLASVLPSGLLYIDISGLGHHVWATFLRVALVISSHVRVMYAEPESYKPHPSPASPSVFDLSTGFQGLSALPGMARLAGNIFPILKKH